MTVDLQPDCARCAALCCVALAFDRSDRFAYDKPACEPCRNLGGDDRCRIYDRREREGFSGCIRFDCQGARQLRPPNSSCTTRWPAPWQSKRMQPEKPSRSRRS